MKGRLRRLGQSLAVFAWAAGLAVIACGPKVDVENPSPFEEDDPRAGQAPTDRAAADRATVTQPEPPSFVAAEILRADYDEVVAAGAGRYMREVEVEPVMSEVDGAHRGWRVVRWPYCFIDLQPGDIVLSVNGLVITRPDDLHRLWEALPDRDAVEILIDRAGAQATLRAEISAD